MKKAKKEKSIKLWNGRGHEQHTHLYIGAYSKADACRMLADLYQMTVHQWNREITIYFNPGGWGNTMDGIAPARGIWQSKGYPVEAKPKKIYG